MRAPRTRASTSVRRRSIPENDTERAPRSQAGADAIGCNIPRTHLREGKMPRRIAERSIAFALAWLLTCAPMRAAASGSADGLDSSGSELRPLIERYTEDRNTLSRVYDGPLSPVRRA